jgi:hypothetical protein
MSGAAKNQNFYFGGEFDCVAIPGASVDVSQARGRVVNEGFAGELSADVSSDRNAELGTWSSQRLLEYVRQSGSKLTSSELKFLFGLALERIKAGCDLPASLLLSQVLMDTATSRMRP